jgi:hypothetical protein
MSPWPAVPRSTRPSLTLVSRLPKQKYLRSETVADQPPTTGFLDNDFDMYALQYQFNLARQFVEQTTPLSNSIIERVGDQVGVETDADIDAFHRDTVYVRYLQTTLLGTD